MQKTNIMQSERIPRLIIKMSLPMMISMLIQALYNVVDSIFVARISQSALTAVSLAFPLQNLLIAVSVGTAVGVNSLIARRLGEGKLDEVNKVANTALFISIVEILFFILFGIFLTKPFLKLFTTDPELLGQSVSYASICVTFSFAIFLSLCIEKIIQGTGNTVQTMYMQILGAVTNIILDPIFIFVFKMGVKGAAIATVIGQISSLLLAIYYVKHNEYVRIKIKKIKPRKKIIREIFQVGLPSIIMNLVGTVMVSILNGILISFSAIAVSVFGIYFKLQSFVFMPVFGLNSGIIPILGFNYGAKNKRRMIETIRYGLIVALTIMILGTILFQTKSDLLLSMFNASEEMYAIGVPALRTISLCFIPAAISIILIASFQSIGFGFASMIVSIVRQLVVLCPCAAILGSFIGINGVWLSFTIAEVFGLSLSVIFFTNVYKKKIKPLP